MKSYVEEYFKTINDSFKDSNYYIDKEQINYDLFFDRLLIKTKEVQKNNGRIFFIGNGASAAFANHMSLDWSKNGGVLALSLSDSSLLTALSNDYSYESAFVEFLKINKVNSSDVVVTISSSGNSGNIVKVLDYCNEFDIVTFGLSGLKDNNESIKKAGYSIYVPRKTYGVVECVHQIFLHLWLDKFMNIEDWARDSFQDMNSSTFNL
ncbi:SIS domain-containing protein [Joostella sp. CR20]|uniref:SIS domain-containing protein n=1 Tax=Joostella sp. CR20 TaxID=2804312 RepID=UPI00313C0F95